MTKTNPRDHPKSVNWVFWESLAYTDDKHASLSQRKRKYNCFVFYFNLKAEMEC